MLYRIYWLVNKHLPKFQQRPTSPYCNIKTRVSKHGNSVGIILSLHGGAVLVQAKLTVLFQSDWTFMPCSPRF
ncbi:Uncharacterised protein [Budvicia aquatica]|uniref:Uncharacterized protein n=1 Tax=Budvicia aquatica TaxID=82979 RepID=A0A484ZU46_9GAMM|nr:Uncharacterised protein [Budvicia aquatica]